MELEGGSHSGRERADARRDEARRRAGYRVVRVPAELVELDVAAAVQLPAGWPSYAKVAVLHVTGLAHAALARARGWCAGSRIARVRLAAEVDRLTTEVALLREELRIKEARMC